ncbi:putative aspartic-type endopeptidase OPSB [Zalerion maritima]|uniref:Aspartic-type endopeptidase OPSB n=1 Tax=Zalerion maritima TaxID=339359 RepID=A0AAD5RX92_9PEZI|nr:putative aspartic-type endopeptidase OPSB [Zalerion maritima]
MRFLKAALFAAEASASTLSMPIRKRWTRSNIPAITRRDDGTLDLTADNLVSGGGYYADVLVGTPGQTILMHLDTGSSDTWVNSVENSAGVFDPDDSSTYELVDENGFSITYLDGREIEGDYFNDTVTIDDKEILAQQLGIALTSADTEGLMGLGLRSGVAADEEYTTIIENMVVNGLIGRASFSLYLNDQESESGSILFGGIDTEKYVGDLTTIPLTDDLQNGTVYYYSVPISQLAITNKDGETDTAGMTDLDLVAILDSGSTVSLVADDLLDTIGSKFDVQIAQGFAFIDCKWAGDDGADQSVDFTFGDGATIQVPVEELVVETVQELPDNVVDALDLDFDNVCAFGLQPLSLFGIVEDRFALIGDTVLRSAYIVYDVENSQIGIAQANLNSTESNIVALSANETSLPTVSGVDEQEDDDDSAGARPVPQVFGIAVFSTLLVVLSGMVL